MRRPNPNSVPNVKAAVRARDGGCTICGMTNAQHVAKTSRQLEVHRKTPGSPYTLDGCVTLCRSCHGSQPKRGPGGAVIDMATGQPYFTIIVAPALRRRLDRLAPKMGLTVSNLVRMVLYENLKQYEDRVARLKESAE